MQVRTTFIALGAAATLALGGCSMLGGGDEGSDAASSSSGQSSGTSATTGTTDAGTTDAGAGDSNGAKQAGIDLDNPPAPIAETRIKDVGDDIDETTIELLELRRDDNVMLATFRLTGDGRGREPKTTLKLLGLQSFRPVLLDMKNLEKYEHVEDLTSDETAAAAPLGEPVYVFTAFPLPREGVTAMDLQVTPGSPAIEDVPMPQ